MLESDLDGFFVKRVRLVGGMTFKLAPTTVGMPDRLVIMPGGAMYLVELKTGTRIRPAQQVLHDKLEKLGCRVHVVRGRAEVLDWVRRRLDDAVPEEYRSESQ